jgi:hypothetical protein
MAKVGKESDPARRGVQQETDGIVGVMGDAEGFHRHVPDFKC